MRRAVARTASDVARKENQPIRVHDTSHSARGRSFLGFAVLMVDGQVHIGNFGTQIGARPCG
jgi:hypothetical protein